MNRLVPHHGEQGRANELTLSRLLESLLPSNVSVGSGIIFDSAGRASGQTDLILYDASSQPRFLAQTTQFLFPVETVLAAIEVKTTLDDEELGKVTVNEQGPSPRPSIQGWAPPTAVLPDGLLRGVAPRNDDQQNQGPAARRSAGLPMCPRALPCWPGTRLQTASTSPG